MQPRGEGVNDSRVGQRVPFNYHTYRGAARHKGRGLVQSLPRQLSCPPLQRTRKATDQPFYFRMTCKSLPPRMTLQLLQKSFRSRGNGTQKSAYVLTSMNIVITDELDRFKGL